MARLFGRDVEIVPEHEIIRRVTTTRNAYVAWIGAGASAEAGVKTGRQICQDIRNSLATFVRPANEDDWARLELNWADELRRYSTCLTKYGPPADRVRYFRQLILGLQPAFCHHAVAMLMQAGHFKKTCLTTNFDKLMEMAFAQQGNSEFQAIRSDGETSFWRQEDDKCYIVKLHGDYDAHNIRNTSDETVRIPIQLQRIGVDLLKQSGMIVLGSSGYESSVLRFLEDALSDPQPTIMNLGLYWGVNTSGANSANSSPDDLEALVIGKLKAGSVSRDLVEIVSRHDRPERPLAFFPVQGTGNFLFKLIRVTGNNALIGRSSRFLDHTMRLRYSFERGGLTREAINARLEKLKEKSLERWTGAEFQRRSLPFARVWSAKSREGAMEIEVIYGDITSRSLMTSDKFPSGRRAVVSPDDTFLSAGGGVSLALLEKAGKYTILNELSKFPSIGHREVVATSGGDLPVNYVLHAAATKLDPNGTSHVSPCDVTETIASALAVAATLRAETVFIPLIAAGLEGMDSKESLAAILIGAQRFESENPGHPRRVVVVIKEEGTLGRVEVGVCVKQNLGSQFDCQKLY
jgi:O-acetyl-ADP-ribose deacetylase (regulator of RNase III)